MNKIECKILAELDKNSRQGAASIARTVGVSKQVAGYHVRKLLEGPIKKALAVYDLSALGLIVHKVYLRLARATEEDERAILRFLLRHPSVSWLARTEGIYDIGIAIHTRTALELNGILHDFEREFGSLVSERIVNRVIGGEFLQRTYLGAHDARRSPCRFYTGNSRQEIDQIDKKILSMLSKDARLSSVSLSPSLPIGADAVRKRIRALEGAGVITSYTIVLDDKELGQLHYKVLMRMGGLSGENDRKFAEFCLQHQYITFYNKSIGAWDMEIDMEVPSSADFRAVMRDLKREFADTLKEYFSLIVYDVEKFDFLPGGMADEDD